MSSEAITQNDLREILSRTVGSIPSEYKKLLWTNPSPTSAFGAQQIFYDLSAYDAIEVVATMYVDGANAYRESFLGAIGASIILSASIYGGSSAITRLCEIRDTYVYFNAGYSSTTLNNSAVIPYQIYGIKYERVAPPQVDASDYVIEQGVDGDWRYRKWESGMTEMWFYKLMSVPSVNTAIAVPSNLTINVSHIRTEQVSGTGDGFVGDIHHLWVRSTGTEVYVTPSTAGNYGVSLYIVFDE